MRHDHESTFMSGPVAAPRADPLFAWLGPLAGFAELGTARLSARRAPAG